MPKMSVSVSHALSEQEAAERLKKFLAFIQDKYKSQFSNLEQTWVGNVLNFGFTTFGFPIKGSMSILPTEVKVDGDLPFAAMMFKGKIEQTIKDNLSRELTRELT